MGNSINSSPQSVSMIRAVWNHRQYFLDQWRSKDITVLITQRKTKDITQLCVESLLRYYPDVPILLVDGDSKDDSTLYCRWMAVKHPNITLWERPVHVDAKHSSHGETMDAAMMHHITTKYVLLLDSDTITERGGWIEPMLEQMSLQQLFAIGSLMLMSRKEQAILWATEESDTLRYAHPSCSLLDREKYLEIRETFTNWHDGQKIRNAFGDHGSPLVWTMMGAEQIGYKVEYFPVDRYVSHLSGASWCEPKTIWPDDHGVLKRPFVTFIGNAPLEMTGEINNDYDFVDYGDMLENHVVVHGQSPVHVANSFYEIRFKVNGEYVCENNADVV